MLKFFINLRNYFYTQSPGPKSFDYKFSMSVLFIPYYFIVLSIVDVVLRNKTGIRLTEHLKHESFLEKILKTLVFWMPLAVIIYLIFRLLNQYEPRLMEKKEKGRWRIIALFILVLGGVIYFALLGPIFKSLGLDIN